MDSQPAVVIGHKEKTNLFTLDGAIILGCMSMEIKPCHLELSPVNIEF